MKNSFDLNGVEITINALYSEGKHKKDVEYVKEIKGQLEAEHGVKISKKTAGEKVKVV